MSLETWKAEFYPVEAYAVPAEQAVAHSLRKWEGLRNENLKRHNVVLDSHGVIDRDAAYGHSRLFINAQSCALCEGHYNSDAPDEYGCERCPLAIARDGNPCDCAMDGESFSPWSNYSRETNPEPMIFWLKKASEL